VQRIKALAFSLLILVGVSMAVTNFVILPFWASDIVSRERQLLQRMLAAASGPAQEHVAHGLPASLKSYLDENPEGCIHWQGTFYPPLPPSGPSCQHGLQTLMAATEHTGAPPAARPALSLLDLVSGKYLQVALADTPFGPVAASMPLTQALRPLWVKERVILVYLVFNAIILTALSFFRFLRTYVLPIDRMVQSVENYQGDGVQALVTEQSTNGLGRLSRSIEAMVQRIEADREKLTQTVGELAAKNALLQANQREMIRTEKLAAVGRLAAGLAHEIGNPLGVAQGYVQLLGMGQCSEQERDDYLGKTLRELQRMDRLIRRLLDYARSGQGMPTWLDPHALLAGMVDDLAGQPFLKGISLTFTPQVPRCDLLVDGEQLRQVILNCLLNAADAIDAAGRRSIGKITIATAQEMAADEGQPLLRLTIADNGGGVPEPLLETVFDPFFTTKEPGSGTGLGLSVSLALIESMGGRMELHSREGEGATVLIALPLAVQGEADEAE